MKKTKIICTMGPACENRETLIKMIENGMNVARFNFSHGSHEEHEKRINLVKAVREELNLPIALLLDTKGPEYRIKTFKDGKVEIKEGQKFAFTSDDIEGDETRVSVSYPKLVQELSVGDVVLLNNGLIEFEVTEITDKDAVCVAKSGGMLSNRKSMSFPNKVLSQEYLSDYDKDDLLFGIKMDMDFVAASFVSNKEDLIKLRSFLNENGGEGIDIIAKIENRSGVDNIEEIIEYSDGIMVARGDLGVEIPYIELPAIQKRLIRKCRLNGKRVVTATEMLESMTTNPRPTRAEISDVANAVYDGTSALMLSGETAVGKYPVDTVAAMSKIAEETEANIDYAKRFHNTKFKIKNSNDAFSHATCALAIDVDAKVIAVCTKSGATARMVSRFRPPKTIVAVTTTKKEWIKLALSWAVVPVLSEEFRSVDVLLYHAVSYVKKLKMAEKGDKIVITAGMISSKSGNTDLIKLEEV